jgi:hypothetical protein
MAPPRRSTIGPIDPYGARRARRAPTRMKRARFGHSSRVLTIRSTVALVPAVLLALTGCASVGHRADAADTAAIGLLTAIQRKDGAAACAILAPDTADEVAQSGDKPCAEAILDEQLPRPGTVTSTDVYGQWARVRLSDDTLFLAVFPDGWRVVAAGCMPRADRPYQCVLQGA